MANQGPESRLTVCCTYHNDGRGLERDLGANGAEMLASQTVLGQFRNTPSPTTPGQDAGEYRPGQPRQRSLCEQQNPTDNHCYMNGIMRFGRGARKDSGEEIRAGKAPEHGR
jgi:hypothetical protein